MASSANDDSSDDQLPTTVMPSLGAPLEPDTVRETGDPPPALELTESDIHSAPDQTVAQLLLADADLDDAPTRTIDPSAALKSAPGLPRSTPPPPPPRLLPALGPPPVILEKADAFRPVPPPPPSSRPLAARTPATPFPPPRRTPVPSILLAQGVAGTKPAATPVLPPRTPASVTVASYLPPARPRAETLPSIRRQSSFPPTAISAPPSAPPPARAGRAVAVALVAIGALLAGATLALLALPRGLATFGPDTGSLIVDVAAPSGGPFPGLAISVDGETRCSEAPCHVENLERGAHVVEVAATGYDAVAPLAVSISGGGEARAKFELTASPEDPSTTGRDPNPAAATPEMLALVPARPGSSPAAHARKRPAPSADDAPKRAAKPTAQPPAKSAKKEATTARISVNTTPAAHVILDGRPLGTSPISAEVPPGAHTVVVALGDGTRRVIPVTLVAGEARTLSTVLE